MYGGWSKSSSVWLLIWTDPSEIFNAQSTLLLANIKSSYAPQAIWATDMASFCVRPRLTFVVLIDLRGPDCGSSYRQHFAAPWLRRDGGWRRWEDATPQTPETRQFWRSMILLVSWISTWCDELGCDAVMNMAWIQPQRVGKFAFVLLQAELFSRSRIFVRQSMRERTGWGWTQ